MFGMGLAEFLIILVIVLLFFGLKLPEVGEGLGKAIRGFRKSMREQDEIDVTPESRQESKERDKESS
jgi:sec-independent protein translocase protein TatA